MTGILRLKYSGGGGGNGGNRSINFTDETICEGGEVDR